MISPAHPSLRTFPRLQLSSLLLLPLLSLSLSLSSQLCFNSNPPASVLLSEQLDTLLTLSSISLLGYLQFSLFSLPLLLPPPPPCITYTLQLSFSPFGHRSCVFPSSPLIATSFPPSIHPSLLLLSCHSPLAVSYKPLFCLLPSASVVVSFSFLSLTLLLSLSLLLFYHRGSSL